MINLNYDHYILAFSGGKDSLACLLHLLEQGVPREKIELWHHLIDGREGSKLMDWPVTEDYCKKISEAFKIPLFFSWRTGGFEREMLRDQSPTAPTQFEKPMDDNIIECGLTGGKGPAGTRLKFPQVAADLRVRWCSAYLKIDVCTSAIANQSRFNNKRTLVITGERAEESPSRAKYKTFEADRSDRRNGKAKRHVDHWRPVHSWSEADVWAIIEKWKVNPHPAYVLGWGRLSCMKCIFGSVDQWASIKELDPEGFEVIANYEKGFDSTIHRTKSVTDQANEGEPFEALMTMVEIREHAMRTDFNQPVFLDTWSMPAGAFGDSAGAF